MIDLAQGMAHHEMGIDDGGQRIAQFVPDGRRHLAQSRQPLAAPQGGVGGVEFGRALGDEVGGIAVPADQGLDRAADGQGQQQADEEDDQGGGVRKSAGQRAAGLGHQQPFGLPDGDGAVGRGPGQGQRMGVGQNELVGPRRLGGVDGRPQGSERRSLDGRDGHVGAERQLFVDGRAFGGERRTDGEPERRGLAVVVDRDRA